MLLFSLPTLVVLLASLLDVTSATSAPSRPLKRLAHPSTLALEILPRQAVASHDHRSNDHPKSHTLRYSDSFRLTLSAFDETVHIHLRPNENLIHPAARINYYGSNGQLAMTVPLLRENIKAYWGEVIPEHESHDRMREDTARVVPRPNEYPELGWARIMVHHQGDVEQGLAPVYEGAFSLNGQTHHIMTKDNYLRHKHEMDPAIADVDDTDATLVIWRDSDILTEHEEAVMRAGGVDLGPPVNPQTCGHDHLSPNSEAQRVTPSSPWYDPFGVVESFGNFTKRQSGDVVGDVAEENFKGFIGSTEGCFKEPKVLFMGVAADCEYTRRYGSEANATTAILTNWNSASALYKRTFNVALGIVELDIHEPTCPTVTNASVPWNTACNDDITLNQRLSLFSEWRGQRSDSAGLWHLMSNCPTYDILYLGTEVGIAWLRTLCQQSTSGRAPAFVSGTAVSTAGKTEWQVIAHEIGHNFGAIHDCADDCATPGGQTCCPLAASGACSAGARFLMSPVASKGEMIFSPCTIGNVCSLMAGVAAGQQSNTTCLIDADQVRTQTFALKMCGNGIVEEGEDCDPGSSATSACCDPTTCKFRGTAVCDPESSQCCTDQCSFAPAATLCRAAKDTRCDTPEVCTGNSSTCPRDIFSPNGKSCGGGDLLCASGICTSADQQCQQIGASMGLQKACPSRASENSCQVSCQNPKNSNQCIVLQSTLIDGSECGFGGFCAGGQCQPGPLLSMATSWYTKNLTIAIPVSIAMGILIVIMLAFIIRGLKNCCCGSKIRKSAAIQKVPEWRPQPISVIPAPPPMSTWQSFPDVSREPSRNNPPPFMRPGTQASYNSAPASVHNSSGSGSSGSGRTHLTRDSNGGYTRQPVAGRPVGAAAPVNPIAPGSDWVDATQYNGKR